MSTYINVFQKTDDGRTLTLEDTQHRRTRGRELVEREGGELKALYYGLGQYDIIAIIEAPDTDSMAKIQLAYEQLGLTRAETFEMFDPDEWDAILKGALA